MNADLGTDKITVKHETDYHIKQLEEKDSKRKPENLKIKQYENNFDVMQLSLHKELPFTIAEADFWFESAEDIYAGKVTRSDLPFYRGESLKCFLDFSVFENIDLRNVLLLYDTVYIALPLNNFLDRFLEQQGITYTELIDLVDMGKVVLLLPNLETRYDKKLLLEVYKLNPNAIVGRRGINALLATYLVETKQQYEKRLPGIYNLAADIFMHGLKYGDGKTQNIARLIAWPITATADSFRYLNLNSPLAVSNFGINNVVYDYILEIILEKENIKYNEQNKILFEFTVNSLNAHIAAALKATYFPFYQHGKNGSKYTDEVVSRILGDFLRLYWYDADNIQNIKEMHIQGSEDYLNFCECKDVSILRVAALADEYKTHEGFRDILSRLGQMDKEQRKNKIREYNDLLDEVRKIKNNNHGGFFKFVLGSAGFLPLRYEVSFILTLIGMIKEYVDTSPNMKRLSEMKAIEICIKDHGIIPDKQTVEDIYLLDKISSVAVFKRM